MLMPAVVGVGAREQGKAAQEVGQAGIEAFANVRNAMEQAAYILWFHARGATIDVVNHTCVG
jgi:hypothetical protein